MAEYKRMVVLRPSSAAEKAARFELPEGLIGKPLQSLLDYALGADRGVGRSEARVLARVQEEMKTGTYGIAVNGDGRLPGQLISDDDFKEQEFSGAKYRGIDVTVSMQHEGGGIEYRVR